MANNSHQFMYSCYNTIIHIDSQEINTCLNLYTLMHNMRAPRREICGSKTWNREDIFKRCCDMITWLSEHNFLFLDIDWRVNLDAIWILDLFERAGVFVNCVSNIRVSFCRHAQELQIVLLCVINENSLKSTYSSSNHVDILVDFEELLDSKQRIFNAD